MTLYTCKICSKTFERLSSYKKHTEKRKNPCKAKYKFNPAKNEVFTEKMQEIPAKIKDKNNQNEIKNKDINILQDDNKSLIKPFICEFCYSEFTRSDNLKVHLENRCKVKKEQQYNKDKILLQQMQEQVSLLTYNLKDKEIKEQSRHIEILEKDNNELKNDNNELKKQLTEILAIIGKNGFQVHTNSHNTDNSKNITNTNNNTLNNTNNGNITNNNFHIEKLEFGKEDLTKLTDKFFINTLMNYYGAEIPNKIIESIHFNSNFMENMNVFITDSSRNKAMIYDGEEWKITTASSVVDNLLDKAVIFCENKHDELREKIENSERHKKKINKEMDTMKIMTNYEPYDYNDDGQPIDIDGVVRPLKDFKRGKKLNERAKELITLTLQNKKNIILESEKKPKEKKYLKRF